MELRSDCCIFRFKLIIRTITSILADVVWGNLMVSASFLYHCSFILRCLMLQEVFTRLKVSSFSLSFENVCTLLIIIELQRTKCTTRITTKTSTLPIIFPIA